MLNVLEFRALHCWECASKQVYSKHSVKFICSEFSCQKSMVWMTEHSKGREKPIGPELSLIYDLQLKSSSPDTLTLSVKAKGKTWQEIWFYDQCFFCKDVKVGKLNLRKVHLPDWCLCLLFLLTPSSPSTCHQPWKALWPLWPSMLRQIAYFRKSIYANPPCN